VDLHRSQVVSEIDGSLLPAGYLAQQLLLLSSLYNKRVPQVDGNEVEHVENIQTIVSVKLSK